MIMCKDDKAAGDRHAFVMGPIVPLLSASDFPKR